MNISFICDIDNNDNIPQNLTYDDLYEYCNFSINIQIKDVELSFSSDVIRIDNESIQNFVYNFDNEPCYMTFNCSNGSSIEFKTTNELLFYVFIHIKKVVLQLFHMK